MVVSRVIMVVLHVIMVVSCVIMVVSRVIMVVSRVIMVVSCAVLVYRARPIFSHSPEVGGGDSETPPPTSGERENIGLTR